MGATTANTATTSPPLGDLRKSYTKTYRKARARLNAISDHYDFRGKRVLDLGCHRGYFTFELAAIAGTITGIDGDQGAIAEDIALAQRLGLRNLDFQHALITPEAIKALPHYDVTLFLSVLHHIVANSQTYLWYEGRTGLEYGQEILHQLARKTEMLFFEMGQSDEAEDWAPKLPRMEPCADVWIVKNLLDPAGFRDITIIPPPEFRGASGHARKFIYDHFHHTVARGSGLPIRALRRLTRFDTRDCRPVFMARGG